MRPDGSVKDFGNVGWFTNLNTTKRFEEVVLTKNLSSLPIEYYDNRPDIININAVADIPKDYDGLMGVPISFMAKYNPNQFEIVGLMATTTVDDINFGYPKVNGK